MPLVIAHRTLPRDAPENSLQGIRAAAELGADAVEIDVRLTRDGVPVLLHDPLGLRTTSRPWPVRCSRASSVARWRLRRSHERVPTLDDALEVVDATGLLVAIDTKAPDAAPAVLAALERAGLVERALLWSQHESAVRHYAAHGGDAVDVALLRDALDDLREERFLADARRLGATAISAHQSRITPAFVEHCHAQGLRVHCWFQDADTQRAKGHLDLDGIVTDWPGEARRLHR